MGRALAVPVPRPFEAKSVSVEVNGLRTRYLEAGSGPPLVLLHSGEYGGCAELTWEYNLAELSRHFRVIAPDWLGYGQSAKVVDFELRARRPLRHIADLCELLEVGRAPFVGNSMGGAQMLADATSPAPVLPMSAMVVISGGGAVLENEHRRALVEYDCTREGMARVVRGLFHAPVWSDPGYIDRRYQLSLEPGAWECAAAARLRAPRPSEVPEPPRPAAEVATVAVPTLLISGREDKLKPRTWATELAADIPRSSVLEVEDAGHCPQIERPDVVDEAILDFLHSRSSEAYA